MNHIGHNIAQLRKARDWTQELLADKAGVHTRHVSRWETGRHKPPPKMQERLAEIFQVPLEELVGTAAAPEHAPLDPDTLQELTLLQELDPTDRATIRQVIKAFATKKKMAQLISA